MADTMIRGMAANKQVRFFACNSTDTVEKARITHHTSPVVTNALGRLLTGGVLMGAMCKNEDRCVTSVEGIIDEDVDQSIRNLTRIGSQAMNETDKMVLDIMTHKGC